MDYRIDRLLSVIFAVVFALAIITGVLSFIRLNNIIYNIKSGIRPDKGLLLAKEISKHLTEAENSVKSYSLTRNENDMVKFYQVMGQTGDNLEELQSISTNDDYMLGMIDSLGVLVSLKFDILDQLLTLQDEFLVREVMLEVMQNIQQQENEVRSRTEMQPADTALEEKPARKDNFFRRLFSKKNRKEENVEASVVDTNEIKQEEDAALIMEEVTRKVERVRQQAIQDEQRRKEQELELFRQDKQVMEKISELMIELELREDRKLRENVAEAEAEVSEVKTIILTYGLAALLLLMLVAVSIYTYIRRNDEYRKVLRKAKADAEELALKKEGFLANMSHEIRTPMNIISGYLDLILEGKLEKSQHEKITVVKKSADHLIQLLNNLLDMSKMQAGKLELVNKAFEPREIIRDMELWFGPAAREKGIKLETMVDPVMPQWIIGDPIRLKQILFNLTGNAIKFTSSGKVIIRLTADRHENDKIMTILEVSDTGIGISTNDQQRIFGQFEQVNTIGSATSGGSGLGLSITQQLVKLMDGEIELTSAPGKGSTFRLKIPFGISGDHDPDALPAMEECISLLSGLNVLVVDDEAYNRKLVKMMLKKYQCNVSEAESGLQAVEFASKNMVDLILMDIRMKGMSGIQAARAIRDQGVGSGRHLPVIAISAEISNEDYKNLKRHGINEFLAKPFDEATLIRAILRQVRHTPPESNKTGSSAGILYSGDNVNRNAGFDITPLIDTSGGNENFLREMLLMFIENTSSGLQQIKEHLDRQERLDAIEIAHRISGPCRHLKAMELHGYLKEIQEVLKGDGHLQQAAGYLQHAMNIFERIKEDILHILHNGNYDSNE